MSSGCTSLGADLRPSLRRHGVGIAVAFAAVLGACHAESADPTNTVGSVPIETTPTTLLPVVVDTLPPEQSTTLPIGLMFGGDVCSALTDDDFTRIDIDGAGPGTLLLKEPLADDACGFVVRLDRDELTIVVRARAAADMQLAGADGSPPEPVEGVGAKASVRQLFDGTFDVIVQADNGWFSVTSRGRDTAIELARRAMFRVEA